MYDRDYATGEVQMTYGKVATTVQSKNLDNMVKSVRDEMKHDFAGISMQKKLHKNDFANYFNYVPSDKGCEPDGGIWFFNRLPVVVIEAKHENMKGNAHERWWENPKMISYMNPKCIYHTLATGTGCRKKWVDMQYMTYEIFNKRNLLDTRWTLKENGFTIEDVRHIFISSLNTILDKNKEPFVYPKARGVLDV